MLLSSLSFSNCPMFPSLSISVSTLLTPHSTKLLTGWIVVHTAYIQVQMYKQSSMLIWERLYVAEVGDGRQDSFKVSYYKGEPIDVSVRVPIGR